MNTVKRPFITFLFSILLLLKVFSGLGSVVYANQLLGAIIWIEIVILLYVAVSMHRRGGGVKVLSFLLITVIVLDISTIVITDFINNIDKIAYVKLVGVDIWYILMLCYFKLSKKFKAFKADEISATA